MANGINVRKTNELKSPKEIGIYFRLICMTGPNKGDVYYLTGKRIVAGRGEKTDIKLTDSKVSREHAELTLVDGNYVITDLSNQNGIVVNDKKVKQKQLQDGEKIVLGQTVMKFSIIEVGLSRNELVDADGNVVILNSEELKKNLSTGRAKVEIKQSAYNDDRTSNESLHDKKEGKNKVIVLIIFLAAILYVFMGDDEKVSEKKAKSENDTNFDLESEASNSKKGIVKEDPEVKRKFDMLIHSGRREFREGNYFRAMEEFRRADLLIPGSGMAGYLMSRAKQRLDEDVTKNFDKANKDLDAKKYQSAIISLCGVMQLLQKYPEDERYKNATDKIFALEVELGMEKGEVKCFEEKSADSRN